MAAPVPFGDGGEEDAGKYPSSMHGKRIAESQREGKPGRKISGKVRSADAKGCGVLCRQTAARAEIRPGRPPPGRPGSARRQAGLPFRRGSLIRGDVGAFGQSLTASFLRMARLADITERVRSRFGRFFVFFSIISLVAHG